MTARIAVIDDEAPNRTYLETLLGNAGFHVQAAAGGNDGVVLVEKERPDLVLVDLMMPEVDGFAVCERIRKGPAGADIQIVVLSALDGCRRDWRWHRRGHRRRRRRDCRPRPPRRCRRRPGCR